MDGKKDNMKEERNKNRKMDKFGLNKEQKKEDRQKKRQTGRRTEEEKEVFHQRVCSFVLFAVFGFFFNIPRIGTAVSNLKRNDSREEEKYIDDDDDDDDNDDDDSSSRSRSCSSSRNSSSTRNDRYIKIRIKESAKQNEYEHNTGTESFRCLAFTLEARRTRRKKNK